jgi:hypothetical protein
MALLGPREMSDLSPQSGPKRTLATPGRVSLLAIAHGLHCIPGCSETLDRCRSANVKFVTQECETRPYPETFS